MTIKEEVLEELDGEWDTFFHYFLTATDDKEWCPITFRQFKEAIDLAIQKTLEKVEKEIKKLSHGRGTYYYDLIEAIKKLKEMEK